VHHSHATPHTFFHIANMGSVYIRLHFHPVVSCAVECKRIALSGRTTQGQAARCVSSALTHSTRSMRTLLAQESREEGSEGERTQRRG